MKRLDFFRATLLAPLVAMLPKAGRDPVKRFTNRVPDWEIANADSWSIVELRMRELRMTYGKDVGDRVTYDDGSGPRVARIIGITADTITVGYA